MKILQYCKLDNDHLKIPFYLLILEPKELKVPKIAYIKKYKSLKLIRNVLQKKLDRIVHVIFIFCCFTFTATGNFLVKLLLEESALCLSNCACTSLSKAFILFTSLFTPCSFARSSRSSSSAASNRFSISSFSFCNSVLFLCSFSSCCSRTANIICKIKKNSLVNNFVTFDFVLSITQHFLFPFHVFQSYF